MGSVEVIETIHGKYSKFEVVKKSSVLGSSKFYLHRDGTPFRGPFSSLRDAVEAANHEAH
jgi:hypothetical protein